MDCGPVERFSFVAVKTELFQSLVKEFCLVRVMNFMAGFACASVNRFMHRCFVGNIFEFFMAG